MHKYGVLGADFEGLNPGHRIEFLQKSLKNLKFAKCGSQTPKLWMQTSKIWQRGFENPGLGFLVGLWAQASLLGLMVEGLILGPGVWNSSLKVFQ